MGEVDRVVDVMDPAIGVKPDGVLPLHCGRHVRPLVQWVPRGRERVWGLVWVVRVTKVLYEGVLIWVPVLETGGTTPGPSGCRCAWRRSASWATFTAFLSCTACTNCSSLHCMLTFFGDCSNCSSLVGRDSQYSFSLPKLMIKRLGVGLVSWCGSQPTRV